MICLSSIRTSFRTGLAATTLALAGLAGQSHADSISVSPTNLAVPAGGQQTVLTVRADGPSQSVVQVRAFRWDPSRPANELYEQANVVVSPPISRLNARQELTVRLVRTAGGAIQGRECYRVLVDRLPDNPTVSQTIALRIRHSVPLCFTG